MRTKRIASGLALLASIAASVAVGFTAPTAVAAKPAPTPTTTATKTPLVGTLTVAEVPGTCGTNVFPTDVKVSIVGGTPNTVHTASSGTVSAMFTTDATGSGSVVLQGVPLPRSTYKTAVQTATTIGSATGPSTCPNGKGL